MEKTMQTAAVLGSKDATHLNVNKLQAVICIVASAAVMIGLIAWAVSSFV
jgi:hypothetical protein